MNSADFHTIFALRPHQIHFRLAQHPLLILPSGYADATPVSFAKTGINDFALDYMIEGIENILERLLRQLPTPLPASLAYSADPLLLDLLQLFFPKQTQVSRSAFEHAFNQFYQQQAKYNQTLTNPLQQVPYLVSLREMMHHLNFHSVCYHPLAMAMS